MFYPRGMSIEKARSLLIDLVKVHSDVAVVERHLLSLSYFFHGNFFYLFLFFSMEKYNIFYNEGIRHRAHLRRGRTRQFRVRFRLQSHTVDSTARGNDTHW